VVEVRDLVIRYGDVTAVDALSFHAFAGQVTAVLGPNGAGKTSTIEALEGYRRPSGGSTTVLGLDPVKDHRQLVRRIGVMLQDGGVYPGIRAVEMVRLLCELHGQPRSRAGELLERVGLSDRARGTWRQLSGGEQRRLALACALAGSPEVAFLDEPTSGVDVGGRQLVRQVIRELAASGCAVLLTTHELAEAEKVADRVVIIDRGRLVAEGTPAELMRSGDGGDLLFAAAPGLDLAGLAAASGAPVIETSPGEYRVAAPATPRLVAAVTGWLAEHDQPLADLRAGRQSLEDVFLRLTTPTNSPDGISDESLPNRRADSVAIRSRRRRSR
jgi:ABC-2 type transport system ATP-binding protein